MSRERWVEIVGDGYSLPRADITSQVRRVTERDGKVTLSLDLQHGPVQIDSDEHIAVIRPKPGYVDGCYDVARFDIEGTPLTLSGAWGILHGIDRDGTP